MTNYYFDMDVLANFHEHPFVKGQACRYDFIRNLRPFVAAIALVKTLIAAGENVYISSMAATDNAKQAKIDWLAEYLPEISADHIIIIVGGGNKADYIKTQTGILVDDQPANIRKWEKAGYTGVLVEVKGEVILP